jgi:hypothetical protein
MKVCWKCTLNSPNEASEFSASGAPIQVVRAIITYFFGVKLDFDPVGIMLAGLVYRVNGVTQLLEVFGGWSPLMIHIRVSPHGLIGSVGAASFLVREPSSSKHIRLLRLQTS